MKKQHYLICAKYYDEKTQKRIEGFLVKDVFSWGCLAFEDVNKTKKDLKVNGFTDIKDAEKFVQILSKEYRQEFTRRARKNNVERENYGFFILKLNSSRFSNLKVVGRSFPNETVRRKYPSSCLLSVKYA